MALNGKVMAHSTISLLHQVVIQHKSRINNPLMMWQI
jgi:hypothetical protein